MTAQHQSPSYYYSMTSPLSHPYYSAFIGEHDNLYYGKAAAQAVYDKIGAAPASSLLRCHQYRLDRAVRRNTNNNNSNNFYYTGGAGGYQTSRPAAIVNPQKIILPSPSQQRKQNNSKIIASNKSCDNEIINFTTASNSAGNLYYFYDVLDPQSLSAGAGGHYYDDSFYEAKKILISEPQTHDGTSSSTGAPSKVLSGGAGQGINDICQAGSGAGTSTLHRPSRSNNNAEADDNNNGNLFSNNYDLRHYHRSYQQQQPAPSPDQAFAYADQLRHEFRLKQTEFATYAKKLRLVDTTSAYYSILADHLLRVQGELNELARKMADCVIATGVDGQSYAAPETSKTPSSQIIVQGRAPRPVFADSQNSLNSAKLFAVEERPLSVENTNETFSRQPTPDAWLNNNAAFSDKVPIRTYGALQRKLLTSLDERFDASGEHVNNNNTGSNNNNTEAAVSPNNSQQEQQGDQIIISPQPPPPPQSPPPQDDYSEQKSIEKSELAKFASSSPYWCSSIAAQHLQHLSSNLDELEDEMSSAVASQSAGTGVDTTSIYDSLTIGGVALRRVIPATPRDVFGEQTGQRAPSDVSETPIKTSSAPKFSRIAVSSRSSGDVTVTTTPRPYERFVPPVEAKMPEIEIIEKRGDIAHVQTWNPRGSQKEEADPYANSRGFGLKVRSWDGDNKVGALVMMDESQEEEIDEDGQKISVQLLKTRYEDPRHIVNRDEAAHVGMATVERIRAASDHQNNNNNDSTGESSSLKRKGILKKLNASSEELSPAKNQQMTTTTMTSPAPSSGGANNKPTETPSARKLITDQRYKFLTSRSNNQNQHSSVPVESPGDEAVIEMESIDASMPAKMTAAAANQMLPPSSMSYSAANAARRFQFFLGASGQQAPGAVNSQSSSAAQQGAIIYEKLSEEQDVIEYEPKHAPVTVRLLPTSSSGRRFNNSNNNQQFVLIDEAVEKAANKAPFIPAIITTNGDFIDGDNVSTCDEKSKTGESSASTTTTSASALATPSTSAGVSRNSSFLSNGALERNLERMEAPETASANLRGEHVYDELNVTSAITESDIEDFNEILDGTKAESERMSPAELARIDSLRSSLRSSNHRRNNNNAHNERGRDNDSSSNSESEDANNNADEGQEESIAARHCWPMAQASPVTILSVTTLPSSSNNTMVMQQGDSDAGGRVAELTSQLLPSNECDAQQQEQQLDERGDNEQTTDVNLDDGTTPTHNSSNLQQEENENINNNNAATSNGKHNGGGDETPITIHGLDDYELLAKKRLSDNLNTNAVHWKTRFNVGSTSPVPSQQFITKTASSNRENVAVSPKEAARLLMEEAQQDDLNNGMPSKKVNFLAWDARPLVRRIYTVALSSPDDVGDMENEAEAAVAKGPHVYVNMEGYLERLMQGGRQTGTLKNWRRKYVRLRDGTMYTSDKSTEPIEHYRTLQAPLAGAKVFALEDEPEMFTVEETNGRWSAFRCVSTEERRQWLNAFATQTLELPDLFRFIQPLLPGVNRVTRQFEDVNPNNIVILDIGESSIRAGLLRNRPSLPDLFFPASGAKITLIDGHLVDTCYGEDAYGPIDSTHRVTMSHPFKMSVSGEKSVTDFACISGLLRCVVSNLGIEPSKFSLLLTIPFEIGTCERGQLASTVQSFGFSKHYISTQEPLVLYAYGCTDAIIVNIGEHTSVMPVVAGCSMIGGCITLPYGGKGLYEAFNATLPGKHICSFSTPKELLIVRYLAEHLCYVAENYERDLNACLKARDEYQASLDMSDCQLPEGLPTTFMADWGRFHAAERIANPAICHDSPSIAQLIFNAIRACPIDNRRELYRNIILSGGPSCLPGLVHRLEADIKKLLPSNTSLSVRVNRAPFAYHAPYVGATILAAKPEFSQFCSSNSSTTSSKQMPPLSTC